MEQVIRVSQMTKDYGGGKGVFDLNLSVTQGEVFGFLGPNGAGKSTTIRQLMGFVQPDKGDCSIFGMNCFRNAWEIQRRLGYLPGELALFSDLTGQQMLDFAASLKGVSDRKQMKELTERFELNPKGRIRKMSKGMKQKVGLICAFLGDPEVLILDEPTSGLDPLMQNRFVELIQEERNRGRTIFMSSHDFDEVERTCSRVGIIRGGRLVDTEEIRTLSRKKSRIYTVTLKTSEQAAALTTRLGPECRQTGPATVTVTVGGELTSFLRELAQYEVMGLDVRSQSLEELFMGFYGEGEKVK